MSKMIIDDILAKKRVAINERKRKVSSRELYSRICRPTLSLKAALDEKGFGLIAEIKRASPSAGCIDAGLDIGKTAQVYRDAGVAGISVITCEPFFCGSPDDMLAARRAVDVPLLLKDFVTDGYQVLEGRACGADVVLLILRILSDDSFLELSGVAESLSMEIIVEVHTRCDLERAVSLVENWDGRILGINNRNLETLDISLNTTFNLIKSVDRNKILTISESGIRDKKDIDALREAGISGALVGESILKSRDTKAKLRELL